MARDGHTESAPEKILAALDADSALDKEEIEMLPIEVVRDRVGDLAYSKQFFSITHHGHTRPTAEFGAPALVWHVAIWPRRDKDPRELDVRDGSLSGLKTNEQIHDEYDRRVRSSTDSLNKLLLQLQRRGCVTGGDPRPPFDLQRPLDWRVDPPGTPFRNADAVATIDEGFDALATESFGFTLWWPDVPRGKAANRAKHELSLLGDGPGRRPEPTDVRVRVQAEMSEDFSSITFIIDAGKPWDEDPIDCAEAARSRGILAKRRAEIFQHVENVRSICENRLNEQAPALVDLPPLPERICGVPPEPPSEIIGKREADVAKHSHLSSLLAAWERERGSWLGREEEAACKLLCAADYLYKTIWDDFCRDFGFNLYDIAGRTSEVFANSRGLIMSTSGMTDRSATYALGAAAGDSALQLPRFNAGHRATQDDAIETKAIVKAFEPFMRRFHSNADWRDWIACGIFDQRAIYISPNGARSEFREWDEGHLDTAVPAGHLPSGLGTRDHERLVPETYRDDQPAPFRYLVLTKHAPNRKQIGRMIERINASRVSRLYALKNWTVIQQASTWVRVYGRRLDEVYEEWIRKTRAVEKEYLDLCNRRWRADLERHVGALRDPEVRSAAERALRLCDSTTQARAIAELSKLCERHCAEPSFTRDWFSISQKLDREEWNNIRSVLDDLRSAKEEHDIALAEISQTIEQALVRISAALDKLGQAAAGGLSYRIHRSRYFAELFRIQAKGLRDSSIETWLSYSQFAERGMEPVLRFIESIANRLSRLSDRLQSVKEDILQAAIAGQTEATRDNTHKLERIQSALLIATERSAQRIKYLRPILIIGFIVTNVVLAAIMLLKL
jgi:hypothetical protein